MLLGLEPEGSDGMLLDFCGGEWDWIGAWAGL